MATLRTRTLEYFLGALISLLLIAFTIIAMSHRLCWTWLSSAALTLSLVFLLLQSLRIAKAVRRARSEYIILKSDTGSVRVHATAIEEALRRTARTLPEVHDAHIHLITDRQTSVPTAGEVDVRIKDMTNIISVHDALSRVLAERYQQIIPGAPPIDFHLTIRHHDRTPDREPKRMVPPEEDETKAIRAPQYPIPDDNP